MALTDITFKKEGDSYVSTPFAVTGYAVGVHLDFAESTESNFVDLQQSCTGEGFCSFCLDVVKDQHYDKNILDVIPGQYIRIKTTLEPTTAKYLE